MQHYAFEIFKKPFALLLGCGVRVRGSEPELFFVGRQAKALAVRKLAIVIDADEHEVAIVCHEHLLVAVHIPHHLFATRYSVYIFTRGFDLNSTARGQLTFAKFSFGLLRELFSGIESAIWKSG